MRHRLAPAHVRVMNALPLGSAGVAGTAQRGPFHSDNVALNDSSAKQCVVLVHAMALGWATPTGAAMVAHAAPFHSFASGALAPFVVVWPTGTQTLAAGTAS